MRRPLPTSTRELTEDECPAVVPDVVGDEGGGGISAGGVPSSTSGAILDTDEEPEKIESREGS